MSMDEKVKRELLWDTTVNHGRIIKGMVGIAIRNFTDSLGTTQFSSESIKEAGEVLKSYGINPAETRIVEWLNRAVLNLRSLPLDERRKLQWRGSDEITDIAAYRERGID